MGSQAATRLLHDEAEWIQWTVLVGTRNRISVQALYYISITRAMFRRHSTSTYCSHYSQSLTHSRSLSSKRGHQHCRYEDFPLLWDSKPSNLAIYLEKKQKICKIWQEASVISLSVSKFLLFYQENASINVALNSHCCPKENFEKKPTFYLQTSLLMCHLQYASHTPGKFAWKQECYCSDILVFLVLISHSKRHATYPAIPA